MKLKAYVVNGVTYYCNEKQIEEAGSLEAAAKAMAGDIPKMKAKTAKAEVKSDENV